MPEKFIVSLPCNICGVITGSLELSSEFGWSVENIHQENLGIADLRCSECETSHGTFKSLLDMYQEKLPESTPEEAESFVKENRTKDIFDEELTKLIDSSFDVARSQQATYN